MYLGRLLSIQWRVGYTQPNLDNPPPYDKVTTNKICTMKKIDEIMYEDIPQCQSTTPFKTIGGMLENLSAPIANPNEFSTIRIYVAGEYRDETFRNEHIAGLDAVFAHVAKKLRVTNSEHEIMAFYQGFGSSCTHGYDRFTKGAESIFQEFRKKLSERIIQDLADCTADMKLQYLFAAIVRNQVGYYVDDVSGD